MANINSIIPHTCPDIDKIIKSISEAQRAIDKAKSREDWSWLDEAENELYGLEDELEKLRKANDSLRGYAQRFLDLRDKVEDLHLNSQGG